MAHQLGSTRSAFMGGSSVHSSSDSLWEDHHATVAALRHQHLDVPLSGLASANRQTAIIGGSPAPSSAHHLGAAVDTSALLKTNYTSLTASGDHTAATALLNTSASTTHTPTPLPAAVTVASPYQAILAANGSPAAWQFLMPAAPPPPPPPAPPPPPPPVALNSPTSGGEDATVAAALAELTAANGSTGSGSSLNNGSVTTPATAAGSSSNGNVKSIATTLGGGASFSSGTPAALAGSGSVPAGLVLPPGGNYITVDGMLLTSPTGSNGVNPSAVGASANLVVSAQLQGLQQQLQQRQRLEHELERLRQERMQREHQHREQQQQRQLEQLLLDSDPSGADMLAALQLAASAGSGHLNNAASAAQGNYATANNHNSNAGAVMTAAAAGGNQMSAVGTGAGGFDLLGSESGQWGNGNDGSALTTGDGWNTAVAATMNLCAEAAMDGKHQSSSSLYIKNLPPEADELYLYQKFAPHGAILSCKAKMDVNTGMCRGVGFVNFAEPACAMRAMQLLHGSRTSQGRQLHITLQAPRAVRAAAAAAQTAAAVAAHAANMGLSLPSPTRTTHVLTTTAPAGMINAGALHGLHGLVPGNAMHVVNSNVATMGMHLGSNGTPYVLSHGGANGVHGVLAQQQASHNQVSALLQDRIRAVQAAQAAAANGGMAVHNLYPMHHPQAFMTTAPAWQPM